MINDQIERVTENDSNNAVWVEHICEQSNQTLIP